MAKEYQGKNHFPDLKSLSNSEFPETIALPGWLIALFKEDILFSLRVGRERMRIIDFSGKQRIVNGDENSVSALRAISKENLLGTASLLVYHTHLDEQPKFTIRDQRLMNLLSPFVRISGVVAKQGGIFAFRSQENKSDLRTFLETYKKLIGDNLRLFSQLTVRWSELASLKSLSPESRKYLLLKMLRNLDLDIDYYQKVAQQEEKERSLWRAGYVLYSWQASENWLELPNQTETALFSRLENPFYKV